MFLPKVNTSFFTRNLVVQIAGGGGQSLNYKRAEDNRSFSITELENRSQFEKSSLEESN